MSIRLDLADTITFERPLTRVVQKSIRIENPNPKPISFKVKTTAPRLYCVRPNSDIIPPNSSMDVQIMLQAFREEPAVDVKCKDKFLILSTFAPENVNVQDLWAHVEANDKGSIHQRKIRCVYGQPVVSNEVNEVPTTVETTPSMVNTTDVKSRETEDMNEKMKKMEEELQKYKKQVENMRSEERVVQKTVTVQSIPYGILIFVALLVASIAYFVKI